MSDKDQNGSETTDQQNNQELSDSKRKLEKQASENLDEQLDEKGSKVEHEAASQGDEEIIDVDNPSQVKVNQQSDEELEKPVDPTSSNSSGTAMAGTALVASFLALAGTGYNWYDTKSLTSQRSAVPEQLSADYSGQIEELQQQIQSVAQFQEKMTQQAQRIAIDETSSADQQLESSPEQALDEQVISSTDEVVADFKPVEQDGTSSEQNQALAIEIASIDAQSEEFPSIYDTMADTDNTETMAATTLPSDNDINQLAMQEIDALLDRAKKSLGLSEVAQLLSIGEQRLTLASDLAGAKTAFNLAEQRLVVFSEPVIDPVIESINSNLEALNAVEIVDKSSLTQDLGELLIGVDKLAFKPVESLLDQDQAGDEAAQSVGSVEPVETSTDSAGLNKNQDNLTSFEGAGQWIKSVGSKVGETLGEVGTGIASDLKEMVVIRKTGPTSDIVLVPEQQYFIRENMKLMIGGAQRAVLQNNSVVFEQNLTQVQTLLSEYFDAENTDVQVMADSLSNLAAINIEPELPDISSASGLLSKVIQQQESVYNSQQISN